MTNYTTLFALQHFTDQTEFERLSLDILNKSGSGIPIPMANRGGGDGGQDIIYENPSGDKSCVFVSLEKNGLSKFKKDAAKHKKGKYREYSYFTTSYLTYNSKKKITAIALNDLGAIVHIYDIEVLRSLLDTRYGDLREKYLGISEDIKSNFDVKIAFIKKYSAVLLEKHAKDLYDETKQKFISKSNYANVYPISLPSIGVRSTDDILKGIQRYQVEVDEFKKGIDDLYSFNLYYTSDIYDENVSVQVTSQDEVTFKFENGVLDQPKQPSLSDRNSFTDILSTLPVSIGHPHIPDKNEFLSQIENHGKQVMSTIGTINAKQRKYLFDEKVFIQNSNGLKTITLKIIAFSKHSSNEEHELVLDLANSEFVEITPK